MMAGGTHLATARPARRHCRRDWLRRDRRRWHGSANLDLALAVIPTLPRPLLCRLTASIIDRLDELDTDPEMEPDDQDEEHDGREEEVAL